MHAKIVRSCFRKGARSLRSSSLSHFIQSRSYRKQNGKITEKNRSIFSDHTSKGLLVYFTKKNGRTFGTRRTDNNSSPSNKGTPKNVFIFLFNILRLELEEETHYWRVAHDWYHFPYMSSILYIMKLTFPYFLFNFSLQKLVISFKKNKLKTRLKSS